MVSGSRNDRQPEAPYASPPAHQSLTSRNSSANAYIIHSFSSQERFCYSGRKPEGDMESVRLRRLLLWRGTCNRHQSVVLGRTLLVRIAATYQPQTRPINPKPPPICRSLRICASSAAVVALGIAASAAAMKANSMTRPKKSATKRALTRSVPIMMTKLTIHLSTAGVSEGANKT